MDWHECQWRKKKMSKVDTLLQEIYVDMMLEEADEFIENFELGLVTEADTWAKVAQTKQQYMAMVDKAREAKAAGNSDLYNKLMAQVGKLKEKWEELKTLAKGAASSAATKGSELVTKAQGAVAGATPGQKLMVGGAAAAVAAIAAGVVIYKKFFSQAAKACKGKSGPDKKKCLASFKVKGLQAAKSKILAGMSKCKDDKCKAKLKAKAQSFDAKINSMKGAVAEAVINEYVGEYISELFLEGLEKN